MSDKINSAQIEALIRAKVKEKGLTNDIDEIKLSKIKEKIKSQLQNRKKNESITLEEENPIQPEQLIDTNSTPAQTPASAPEAIAQTVTISKDAVELAKKEGELEQKEKDISNREASVANKEAELQRKQDELSYKPQIPAILEGIGNEQMFIFNKDEISLGAEALSNTSFRLMSNPDDKKTMMELWATEGKKGADLYLVKFDKIGELNFNPFDGTSKFEEKPIEDGQTPTEIPVDGLTPEQAKASQEPTENITDSTEPVSDVSLPLSDDSDMGLKIAGLDNIIKRRIDDMMRQYFSEKFPKL